MSCRQEGRLPARLSTARLVVGGPDSRGRPAAAHDGQAGGRRAAVTPEGTQERELLPDKPVDGAWLAGQESPFVDLDRREREACLCLSAVGARRSLPTIR